MQHQKSGSFLAVVLSLLLIAMSVHATTLPVTISPENLVLRDAYGNIIATSLTVALINNTDGYVQLARALTESGTTYPTDPAVGYLYYRTDLQALYIWTGLSWVTCMTATLPPGTISYNDLSDKPNMSVFLLENGTNALTSNWNVGSYGIYGLTYITSTAVTTTLLNATTFYGYTYYWNNQNRTDVLAYPTAPYSYIIDKVSSTYRMKNGATGQFDYQSINGTLVGQYALGNVSHGGSVYFLNGSYTINGLVLNNDRAVKICGESEYGVILQMQDAAQGAISSDTSFTERSALLIDGSNSTGALFLSDFTINGACERQTRDISGILIRGQGSFKIQNVFINGSSRFGIRTYKDGGEIRNCQVYTMNAYGAVPADPANPYYDNLVAIYIGQTDCLATDNRIGWIGKSGVLVNKGVGIHAGTSATVNRNWVWSCRTAIYADGGDAEIDDNFIEANYEVGIWNKGTDSEITSNRIRMGGTSNPISTAGIWLSAGSRNLVSDNKIYCRDYDSYMIKYGILENDTASNNYIVDNCLETSTRGNYTVAPISWTSSTTTVFKNDGFDSPTLAADCLIWKDPSDNFTKVMDKYGNIVLSSTDDDDIANAGILGLTSDTRDYYKSVLMVGNFTIDNAIAIYNWTDFRLIGKIALANNLQNTTHPDVIHQATYSGSDLDIEACNIIISGGIYDGNRANGNDLVAGSGVWNYDGLNCIYFSDAVNITVKDVKAINAGTVGIHFDSSKNYLVEDFEIVNPYFHAVHNGHDSRTSADEVWYVANMTWRNGYMEGPSSRPSLSYDREDDGGALVGGTDAGYLVIDNIVVNGSYAQAISLGSGNELGTVRNCRISHVGMGAIALGGDRVIVEGNEIYNWGYLLKNSATNQSGVYAGIYAYGAKTIVSNNIVQMDNMTTFYNGSIAGVYVASSQGQVVAQSNIITLNNASVGLYAVGVKSFTISDNNINANGTGLSYGIYLTGTEGTITSNIVNSANGGGIYAAVSTGTMISSNHLNGPSTSLGHGLNLGGDNYTISGNSIFNYQRGIGFYGGEGNYSLISNNLFRTNINWLYVTQNYTVGLLVIGNSIVNAGTPSLPTGFSGIIRANYGYVTENSGYTTTCRNGTWIAHGLAGDPGLTGSITISLRGMNNYNATMIFRVPTIISSNSSHFQIEFMMWETVGWTMVPVTAVEAQTVYWDATFKP